MSDVYHPDRTACSPGGRYVLSARSPDNAPPHPKDGVGAERNFRGEANQGGFLYRLRDLDEGRLLWQRAQQGENSPAEILVSDEGWSILRTHGFFPEVIAISPAGEDAI